MDKLQWFKFSPTDWIMGKIQRCPEITQARYIRLMCLYWNKDCELSYEDAEIEIDKDHLDILVSKRIIKVQDGYIYIDFLDEQMDKIGETSNKRREAVLKRWEILKQTGTNVIQENTNVLQNDTDKIREDKKRVDKKGRTLFRNSIYFDKAKFKEALPEWNKAKLLHYYESALNWSDSNGEMKKDWIATVKIWARKDEKEGKVFTETKPVTGIHAYTNFR